MNLSPTHKSKGGTKDKMKDSTFVRKWFLKPVFIYTCIHTFIHSWKIIYVQTDT